MTRHCRPWRDEDDAALAETIADGATRKEAASRLGRSVFSVTMRRGVLGLPKFAGVPRYNKGQIHPLTTQVDEMRRAGVSYRQIAEKLHVSRKVIAGIVHRHITHAGESLPRGSRNGSSPLRGREDEIRRLSQKGMSSGDIARRFLLPQPLVANYMSYHGLHAPDRKRCQRAPKPQTYRLGVNVARLELPEVCEADVRLARLAWWEFERAAHP